MSYQRQNSTGTFAKCFAIQRDTVCTRRVLFVLDWHENRFPFIRLLEYNAFNNNFLSWCFFPPFESSFTWNVPHWMSANNYLSVIVCLVKRKKKLKKCQMKNISVATKIRLFNLSLFPPLHLLTVTAISALAPAHSSSSQTIHTHREFYNSLRAKKNAKVWLF